MSVVIVVMFFREPCALLRMAWLLLPSSWSPSAFRRHMIPWDSSMWHMTQNTIEISTREHILQAVTCGWDVLESCCQWECTRNHICHCMFPSKHILLSFIWLDYLRQESHCQCMDLADLKSATIPLPLPPINTIFLKETKNDEEVVQCSIALWQTCEDPRLTAQDPGKSWVWIERWEM